MKTVLLCRVSSKEQEETGYSLPAQEKLLTTYTERQGFEKDKIFSISESAGGKKQRETFSEMMTYVQKNGIKIIICEKVDRLTRNFKDAVMIDEWLEEDEERQVHLVKDSLVLHKNSHSQEKLNWGIRILFAKNYIDNLSEEVRKGQKEKIAQGWLPTKPPLGYKTVGEKGHKIHVIDESVAPLVRRMFEHYATGNYSLKRLTEMVHKEGLRTLAGKKIVKSRIHQYLTDPFYIGKNRWNGDIYPGNQIPLFDDSLFEKVQRVLKSKTTPKYSKHDYLFKGLITCKECKGMITWETAKGHVYGHCNHYRNCKQTVWIKEPEAQKQLLAGFQGLEIRSRRLVEWIRKALKESHKDEITYHSSSVGELNKHHEMLKQRLDKLYDDKLDGKISEEFYQKKFIQYSEELKGVDKSLSKHTNASVKYFEVGMNFYDISQRAAEIFQRALLDQKRQLIRLVFEKLTLDEGKLEYIYTKPFQILHDAVAATNGSKVLKKVRRDDEIFEPEEKIASIIQIDDFERYRPILLPREDSNLQPSSYKYPSVTKRLGLSHSLITRGERSGI